MSIFLCAGCDMLRDADFIGCNEGRDGNLYCDDCYREEYEVNLKDAQAHAELQADRLVDTFKTEIEQQAVRSAIRAACTIGYEKGYGNACDELMPLVEKLTKLRDVS